jgi:hypothetical protein
MLYLKRKDANTSTKQKTKEQTMKNIKNTIRTAVKSVLANTTLSAYRVNKIVKAEIENPRSWGKPGETDVTEDSIFRYYENIHEHSVFVNFIDHMRLAYGINYFNHIA